MISLQKRGGKGHSGSVSRRWGAEHKARKSTSSFVTKRICSFLNSCSYLKSTTKSIEQDGKIQQYAFAVEGFSDGGKIIITASKCESDNQVGCDGDSEVRHVTPKPLKSPDHAKLDLEWDGECVRRFISPIFDIQPM